jgi:hypothetical protein
MKKKDTISKLCMTLRLSEDMGQFRTRIAQQIAQTT